MKMCSEGGVADVQNLAENVTWKSAPRTEVLAKYARLAEDA
jgi:hypothetical protein